MCCVVIPAYKPPREMLAYLDELGREGIYHIVVVNDGSGPEYDEIFSVARRMLGCHVLQHTQNMGKGAALKTGFEYYTQNIEGCAGVVTADCDGQHSVEDVVKVCRAVKKSPEALIMGSREFGPETPRRSMAGNRVTAVAMRLLYNIRLKDTQTGLRGIPNGVLPGIAQLRGNRYEYELNMLIYAQSKCIPFTLVPIQTIYFEENAGSHYRTITDSARLVGQMLRGLLQYGFSTLLSGLLDLALYGVLAKVALAGLPQVRRLFYAAVVARMASSLLNYGLNRHLPYVQNTHVPSTLLRYYLLWFTQLGVSFLGVWGLHAFAGLDEMFAKLIVDGLLGLASYQVQMRWVFRKKGETHAPKEAALKLGVLVQGEEESA